MSEQDLSPEDRAELERCFGYHPPSADSKPRFEKLGVVFRAVAGVILRVCPPGADRDAALLALRSARMWANASIACDPNNAAK